VVIYIERNNYAFDDSYCRGCNYSDRVNGRLVYLSRIKYVYIFCLYSEIFEKFREYAMQ